MHKKSGYERTSRPMGKNRQSGQGERPLRRPPQPDEGQYPPRSMPPPEPPFQQEDDLAEAPRGLGLLKSPFPMPPPASASRLTQHIWPDEDEEAAAFDFPPRRKRPRDDADPAPRQRRRSQQRDQESLPSGTSGVTSPRKPVRRPRRTALKVLLAIFLLGACSTAAFAGAKAYQFYAIAQSVTGKALPNVGTTKGNVQPGALSDTLSGVNAFNMLLLGSDNDAKFGGGAVLTQTDIVVRIDLANQKVTMVSIPRDMWIPSDTGVCCYKLDEISGAETDGPSTPLLNGLAHTVATVENDFGIPISAYAWVGLQGFINVINTLGGVDVDVLHPIVDDAYPKDLDPNGDPYAYQRLYIPAGPQHLDGEQALNYVRSRHSDLLGDFGRSARQQSVLVALKKKLNSNAILDNLDALANDLKDSVITSLTIPQVLALANFAKGLKTTSIIQKVLSIPDYGQAETLDGKYVIEPDWEAISTTVKQVFTDSAPPVVNLHSLSSSDKQAVTTEGARVLIENGTATSGVADQLATDLKAQGFDVLQATNADRETYIATQIEEFTPQSGGATKFDKTCQVLSKMLGVVYQVSAEAPPTGADIVIIVGSDTASQIQQQS